MNRFIKNNLKILRNFLGIFLFYEISCLYLINETMKVLTKKQITMESIYKHCIVYCLWINGRSCEDVDQHFPVDSYNVKDTNLWYSDFKKAYKDYINAKVKDSDDPHGFYSEIYQDYQVTLFSIDIDINKFENQYKLKFDLEDDQVQDYIPYYVNYNFNVVAERISKFKK